MRLKTLAGSEKLPYPFEEGGRIRPLKNLDCHVSAPGQDSPGIIQNGLRQIQGTEGVYLPAAGGGRGQIAQEEAIGTPALEGVSGIRYGNIALNKKKVIPVKEAPVAPPGKRAKVRSGKEAPASQSSQYIEAPTPRRSPQIQDPKRRRSRAGTACRKEAESLVEFPEFID
jgi:hypothetical protein